jgi:hypothetical protein
MSWKWNSKFGKPKHCPGCGRRWDSCSCEKLEELYPLGMAGEDAYQPASDYTPYITEPRQPKKKRGLFG